MSKQLSGARVHPHPLHQAFLQTLNDVIPRIAADKLAAKAAAQGFPLSKSQRQLLHRRIASGNLHDFRLPDRRTKSSRTVHLKWTAKDSHDLERAFKRVLKQMPRLIAEESEVMAERMLRTLRARWKTQAVREERTRRAFALRLAVRWRQPLEGLAMMLVITREFSEMVGSQLQHEASKGDEHLIAVLVRLHARACQVAAEVLTLLREGFADGAMARWRTLHEIAVIAMFVRDRGDGMAERYLLHSTVESYKAMKLYDTHARRLRLRPIGARQRRITTNTFDALVARFGKPFKSDYGWASETPTEQPNFTEIEAKISVEHWRPYYKLASHNVHANPKGILFKMGMPDGASTLLIGPSNYGLADPGQNTAISLNQVSAALGTVGPTLDTLVFMKLLDGLADEVGGAFTKAQETLGADEKRLRHSGRIKRRVNAP